MSQSPNAIEVDPRNLVRFTNLTPESRLLKRITMLSHLPGVTIAEGDVLAMCSGQILNYSFDEWRSFEGPAAFDWEDYYGSGQTFARLVREEAIESAHVDLELHAQYAAFSARVAWYLLQLTYSVALPHPELSMSYVALRETSGGLRTCRIRGSADLDLLNAEPRLRLQPADFEALRFNSDLLGALISNSHFDWLESLATSLWFINPDVLNDIAWLEFVIKLELFLNPKAAKPLGREFGRRFAAVCATTDAELDAYEDFGRTLYDFRSRALHGRLQMGTLELDTSLAAFVLRRCAEFLISLPPTADHSQLPADMLDAAAVSASRNQSSRHTERLRTIRVAGPASTSNDIALSTNDVETSQPTARPSLPSRSEFEGIVGAASRSSDDNGSKSPCSLDDVSVWFVSNRTKTREAIDDGEGEDPTVSSVEVRRRWLGKDDAWDTMNRRASGPHFAEMTGGRPTIFVPFLGLSCSPINAHHRGEQLVQLEHRTWRSLENRRYKDLYDPIVLRAPRVFLVKHLPTLEQRRGHSDGSAPNHNLGRDVDLAVDAYVIALLSSEAGNLVSPHRLPWTHTEGVLRFRMREDSVRMYTSVMRDNFRPILELIGTGDDDVELQELPMRCLDGTTLKVQNDTVGQVVHIRDRIIEGKMFERTPAFRRLTRLYAGWRDPTNGLPARLIRQIVVLEAVFGSLSKDNRKRTERRMRHVMEQVVAGPECPPAKDVIDAVQSVRNGIAHGRPVDERAHARLLEADGALRAFFLLFVQGADATIDAVDANHDPFEEVKARVLGEEPVA